MEATTIGLIGMVALFTLIFLRIPIGFLMAIIGFVGFASIVSLDAAYKLVAKDFYTVFGSYICFYGTTGFPFRNQPPSL
jgi:C4-dicarboxylate transporter DctM subunit